MPMDFTKPVNTDSYVTGILQTIRANFAAQAKLFNGETITGIVDKCIRYNAALSRLEIYDLAGTAWNPLLPSYLPAAGGTITGATNVSTGDFTVTAGNLIVSAGNITATAGNLSIGGTSTLTGNTTVGGTLGVTGATTLTGALGIADNLTFTGSGKFLRGLWSSTLANRTLLQTTTTNGSTVIPVVPNGSSTESGIVLLNSSTPANSAGIQLGVSAGVVTVSAGTISGTPSTVLTSFTMGLNSTTFLQYDATNGLRAAANPTVSLGVATKDYVDTTVASASGSGHGQCWLEVTSGNLTLYPYNGNKLIIGGTARTIPPGGVALAPPATAPRYFIYAYMSGASMALEASTTGHTRDATTGVEIKTGDASRTLVGQWHVPAGPVWSTQVSLGLNWFNKKQYSISTIEVSSSHSNTTFTLVGAQLAFLTWEKEAAHMYAEGSIYMPSSNNGVAALFVDGTALTGQTQYVAGVTNRSPVGLATTRTLAEGLHILDLRTRITAAGSPIETANQVTTVSSFG